MNSQSIENQPSLDLPPVKAGVQKSVEPKSPEQQKIAEKTGTENKPELKPQGQAPIMPAPVAPSASSGQPQGSDDDSSQSKPTASQALDDSNPMIADDVDLIEKEWVDKAKQIVNQTKDDPYKQNKEINKVKADYIKKRYNKDMRLNEA